MGPLEHHDHELSSRILFIIIKSGILLNEPPALLKMLRNSLNLYDIQHCMILVLVYVTYFDFWQQS